MSQAAWVCVFALVVVGQARAQGAKGVSYGAGSTWSWRQHVAADNLRRQRAAETVQGNLVGPVDANVLVDRPPPPPLAESRWLAVDDVMLLLMLAPDGTRLTLLACALPRLADVQRLDELVPLVGAAERRQAQALVDGSR